MEQQTANDSNNSMLYFLVGALLVAVLVIGYLALRDDGGHTTVVTSGADTSSTETESGSGFKLQLNEDGRITGSIEQKTDN